MVCKRLRPPSRIAKLEIAKVANYGFSTFVCEACAFENLNLCTSSDLEIALHEALLPHACAATARGCCRARPKYWETLGCEFACCLPCRPPCGNVRGGCFVNGFAWRSSNFLPLVDAWNVMTRRMILWVRPDSPLSLCMRVTLSFYPSTSLPMLKIGIPHGWWCLDKSMNSSDSL